MPIDYSKYPENWKSEIRPRIMQRANNTCEFEGCDFKHGQEVYSVKVNGRVEWFNRLSDALIHRTGEKIPKLVTVVLTVAHMDHDEENHEVTDERLKAACQLHHLRYDAQEKVKRKNEKS